MQMNSEKITELDKIAEANDGKCDRCGQTIKTYRYRLNRTHAMFMKAMADKGSEIGKNDIDIGDLNISYSIRTQITKLRLHALVARVKNTNGAQILRHWLITHKGWNFLKGEPIPSQVIVFNNQVLGHGDELTTIRTVLGVPITKDLDNYEEVPVTKQEAKQYQDVRKPRRKLEYLAEFRGRSNKEFNKGELYNLNIDRLQMGKPVKIEVVSSSSKETFKMVYRDIAAFQKEWRVQ